MTDHDIFDYNLLHKISKILIDCAKHLIQTKNLREVIKISNENINYRLKWNGRKKYS